MLLSFGRRWRIGAEWRCARCETVLSYGGQKICVECLLDLTTIAAKVQGRIKTRLCRFRVGTSMLVIAWLALAGALAESELRGLLPTDWLIQELRVLGTDGASDELAYRLRNGELTEHDATAVVIMALRTRLDGRDHRSIYLAYGLLSAADYCSSPLDGMVGDLVDRHGDRSASWHSFFSSVIENANYLGDLSPELWQRYCDGILAPKLVVLAPMPLEPGTLVDLYLDPDSQVNSPLGTNLQYAISVVGLVPPDPADRRDGGSFERWQRFSGSRISSGSSVFDQLIPVGVIRVPEGTGEVLLEATMAVYFDDRGHFKRMPGIWTGEADLTQLSDAPYTARILRRFPIAAAEVTGDPHPAELADFLRRVREALGTYGLPTGSNSTITGSIQIRSLDIAYSMELTISVRAGDVTSRAERVSIVVENGATYVTTRSGQGSSRGGGYSAAMFQYAGDIPQKEWADSCDLILAIKAVHLPDHKMVFDDLNVEIVLPDLRIVTE